MLSLDYRKLDEVDEETFFARINKLVSNSETTIDSVKMTGDMTLYLTYIIWSLYHVKKLLYHLMSE